MYYYKFNIGDYASHTRHLSLMEDLAYRRLLDAAYSSEKPLTKDVHALSRLIGMRDYQSEINDVLLEFFDEVEEGWIHGRVLQEMEESCGRSDKAKVAAKARWERQKNAKAMLTHCSSDATSIEIDAKLQNSDATHNTLHTTQDTDKATSTKSTSLTFNQFLEKCESLGEKRVPVDDPVFTYADKVGIPIDMVRVCWNKFAKSYQGKKKKYVDWRRTFRDCVEGNWYHLWYVEADGSVKETSQYRALKKGVEDV